MSPATHHATLPMSNLVHIAIMAMTLLLPGVSSQTTCTTNRCAISAGTRVTCFDQFVSSWDQLNPFYINNCKDINCNRGYSCAKANMDNVISGGHVDCNSKSVDRQSCMGATIKSSSPFTLTCRTEIGYGDRQDSECAQTTVENPGGSVFCFEGRGDKGSCNSMQIAKNVGCIICGTPDTCRDLVIWNFLTPADSADKQERGRAPRSQVWVQPKCQAAHVLDYLNKMHSTKSFDSLYKQPSQLSPTPNPFYDGNNNNVPDVVEAYCANNQNDANCIQEFQHGATGWTKTVITGNTAVDPDSLPTSGNTQNSNDGESKKIESWAVGAIVVAFLVVSMLLAVLYLGNKNQWSWWKNCCGSRHEEETKLNNNSLDLPNKPSTKDLEEINPVVVVKEQDGNSVNAVETDSSHEEVQEV